MLNNIHNNGPSLQSLAGALHETLGGVPDLERDLARLLELQGENPDRRIEVPVTVHNATGGGAQTLPVLVPIRDLVKAKRSELCDRLEAIEDAVRNMGQAGARLIKFDPNATSPDVLPMVGAARGAA